MTAVLGGTRYVTVVCDGCGGERELTERQARRPGRCVMCRRLENVSVTAELVCWWLEELDDDALAVVLTEASGRDIPPREVARIRALVCAAAEIARPVGVLSSVSERAGLVAA